MKKKSICQVYETRWHQQIFQNKKLLNLSKMKFLLKQKKVVENDNDIHSNISKYQRKYQFILRQNPFQHRLIYLIYVNSL